MIHKVDVLLSFPQGAYFQNNINTLVYRHMLNFIKSISCICIDKKCMECKADFCRYYRMTGENFTGYPGILIKNSMFEKKRFFPGEQKRFTFYLVGECTQYLEYISVYFEHLEQYLFGNLFYLIEIKNEVQEAKEQRCRSLMIKTPIPSTDFVKEYNDMAAYYNHTYHTAFAHIKEAAAFENQHQVKMDHFHVKTKTMSIQGYTGTAVWKEAAAVDMRLLEIGVGKYNFIGGGQIAIKNNTEK